MVDNGERHVTVVLGRKMRSDGRPTAELIERMRLACDVVRRTASRDFILCGTPSEVDAMLEIGKAEFKPLFLSNSMRIVSMTETSNTLEHSLYVRQYSRKHGLRHVHVVTSDYHRERASRIFHSILHNRDYVVSFDLVPCVRMLDAEAYKNSVQSEQSLLSFLHRQLESYARLEKDVYIMISGSWVTNDDSDPLAAEGGVSKLLEDPWIALDPTLSVRGLSQAERLQEELHHMFFTTLMQKRKSFVAACAHSTRTLTTAHIALNGWYLGGDEKRKLHVLPFVYERRQGARDETTASLPDISVLNTNFDCVVCSQAHGGATEWNPRVAKLERNLSQATYVNESTDSAMQRIERLWGYILTRSENTVLLFVDRCFFQHIVYGSFLPFGPSGAYALREAEERRDLLYVHTGSIYHFGPIASLVDAQQVGIFSSGRPDVSRLWPKRYAPLFYSDGTVRPSFASFPVVPLFGTTHVPASFAIPMRQTAVFAKQLVAKSMFGARFSYIPDDCFVVSLCDMDIDDYLNALGRPDEHSDVWPASRWTAFSFGSVVVAKTLDCAFLEPLDSDARVMLNDWLSQVFPDATPSALSRARVTVRWAYNLINILREEEANRAALQREIQIVFDRKFSRPFIVRQPDIALHQDPWSHRLLTIPSPRVSFAMIGSGSVRLMSLEADAMFDPNAPATNLRICAASGDAVLVDRVRIPEAEYFSVMYVMDGSKQLLCLFAYNPATGSTRSWIVVSPFVVVEARVVDELGRNQTQFAVHQTGSAFSCLHRDSRTVNVFTVALENAEAVQGSGATGANRFQDMMWNIRLLRTAYRTEKVFRNVQHMVYVQQTLFFSTADSGWYALAALNDRLIEKSPLFAVSGLPVVPAGEPDSTPCSVSGVSSSTDRSVGWIVCGSLVARLQFTHTDVQQRWLSGHLDKPDATIVTVAESTMLPLTRTSSPISSEGVRHVSLRGKLVSELSDALLMYVPTRLATFSRDFRLVKFDSDRVILRDVVVEDPEETVLADFAAVVQIHP